MTDVLQVKEEPTSIVRESRLPNLPSDVTEDPTPQESLTLEQVANNNEKLRRFELLDRYLLQLSKGEHFGNFDVSKDANYLRKLVRSDDTHVQVKVSELLLQYFKSMNLNTQFDPKLGGIQDSTLLLKLYQVVHDDCCYYLLPNSKAGETFNKFLCNLLSTASSEYVFTSVVRLFQRTVENILSKYNNAHSPSVSKEMSTEDTRVVIGVMKTLLTLTRAFGSPPAPRDVLCSLSVVVINSTNAHTCRVYSYNVAAFLIRDLVDENTRRRLLKGLNEVQYNQVVALVKECNSLNNTCNWKFKYAPSDYVSSSSLRVQPESNSSVTSAVSTNNTSYSSNAYTVGASTNAANSASTTSYVSSSNATSNYSNNYSNTSQNSNSNNQQDSRYNANSTDNKNANSSFSSNNSHYSPSYSTVSSVSNVRKAAESKNQRADASELPSNWYKDLFNTFETNRGEGKSVVVDKNAWKWKNDALLNTLKKLEKVSSVEMESVSSQFAKLFESLFKYESAIPVVINSFNLFTVLTVKGNCDFLNVGKCQLLSDMMFEKLKESNRKVRDSCVQSLVEVVKRSKLSVVSESVKKALVNVSPTCRENMCNFLNGKLLVTSDAEFYEKLQQLLLMLSEYLKQLTSEKVPKVKQAVLSMLEVVDNFSLVYSNQSAYTSTSVNSNSSLYSNMNTSNAEDLSVSKERASSANTNNTSYSNTNQNSNTNNTKEQQRSDTVSTNLTSTTGYVSSSNTSVVNPHVSVSTNNASYSSNNYSNTLNNTTSNTSQNSNSNNLQDLEYTMTTTATSFVNLDSSTEFELESAEKKNNFDDTDLGVSRPRGPMAVENLVDVVDSEVLDRFRAVENSSLDEALYNLCLWMTDNMRLVKSVDFYLLKLVSEFYSSFSNKLTVDMFFSSLFSHPLSSDGFSETLEFLKKYRDLSVLNVLLSKNNSNTNRLLNPLNNSYYTQTSTSVDRNTSLSDRSTNSSGYQGSSVNASQSTSATSTVDKSLLLVLDLLSKLVSDDSYSLVDEVVLKLVSFLSYFVKVKSESCSRLALDLLWSLDQRYEVSRYLDDELVASVTYSKPSKTLSSAYMSSATRFEKYISKDLFMIMFQSDQDYKRRASYYWKGFVGDKTAKSRDMLEGKGRKDLTSWLAYCLFENMCHKYVVAGLELMADYLSSKGLQFDAEESLLLTESLCSYGTFGRYQTKAMSVYHKMARCFSYSFEAVQFMFEYVEKSSAQWATVVSKALFTMLEYAKKDHDKELVLYVSKRLEMSSKLSTYYKNKLRQWVEGVENVESQVSKVENLNKQTAVLSAESSKLLDSSKVVEKLDSSVTSTLSANNTSYTSNAYTVGASTNVTNSASATSYTSGNQVHSLTTTDSSNLTTGTKMLSEPYGVSKPTAETGKLVTGTGVESLTQTKLSEELASVEVDEKLAATSLSEDSLRSKYSREQPEKSSVYDSASTNMTNSSSTTGYVSSSNTSVVNPYVSVTSTVSTNNASYSSVNKSDVSSARVVESSEVQKSSANSEGVESVESQVSNVEDQNKLTAVLSSESTKLLERSKVADQTKMTQSSKVVSSSSSLNMETLETVHQDDCNNMEPVTTTDSNYESKTNFSSSDFTYLSNQLTYRDTSEDLQQDSDAKSRERNNKQTEEDNKEKENKDREKENNNKEDEYNKNKEVEALEADNTNKSDYLKSPEVYCEGKNMRVADRELVEDKGVNLVDQVLLDEVVNVDLDLESCRRLSQQIVDTPSGRVGKVSKRKSKDKYSQTEMNWSEDDKENEKRSCRDKNSNSSNQQDSEYNANSTDNKNTKEVEYNTNKVNENNLQDVEYNTNKVEQQEVVEGLDVETRSYSSRYDKQDKETQMSVSREHRTDRETEVSVVRRYDKETSVDLSESKGRLERWVEREGEADMSSKYYGRKTYMGDRSNVANTVFSDRSKESDSNKDKYQQQQYNEGYSSLEEENKEVDNEMGQENKKRKEKYNNKNKEVEEDNTNKSNASSSSSSKDTYPSVAVEFDSDLDFVSGEVYRLNLVETVLSHCSRVNNSCLVSSYKEYQKLADTLCPGNFSETCLESCTQVLKFRSALKGSLLRLLSSPLVEMCHNAVLLLSKKLIKKLHSKERYDQTLDLEALTSAVEVFKLVTSDLQDKLVLQFCNVVTNLLSLPKDVYQNEKLYCLVSELVADNALKQSTDVMYKLLEVMVELSMESLEGDLDRLLMAKLRFTKILQMQLLLTLKNNGYENNLDAETLKSKHKNFIRRLETFANRRTAHNVEKVIQTSNYLISTI